MAVKVTKRTTNHEARYSITGLTFDQLFRVKNAMFNEAEKMKEYVNEMEDNAMLRKQFEGYQRDAEEVYEAAVRGLI